jgi:hypothetical protein
MPNFNGMGPNGIGPLTVRGLGRGMSRSFGRGFGRRLGWFGVGYGDDEQDARERSLCGALERHAACLRAELERIESLLNDSPYEAVSEQAPAK